MRPRAPSLRWRILALANANNVRRQRLTQRRQARALLRAIDPFENLTEAEFVKTFRLSKDLTRDLINKLSPFLKVKRTDAIPPRLKVLIALAFYASGSYQTLVGQSEHHSVSQPTVSRAVRQVTQALNSIFNMFVKWPCTPQQRNHIKAKFSRFGIPGVLGCVDGTHIAILRPSVHEERFYNRKGFHSLNVMIICDSELNILCVDASSPGSAHDAMVWQNHPLSQHLDSLSNAGEHLFLLGDSAYPLRSTMMTPVLNTVEGTPEHHYYQLHVHARNTVERCIGVLKARFRCLLAARALHYNPITAGKIVNACVVLHNIANAHGLPGDSLTAEEADAESQLQLHTLYESIRSEATINEAPPNRRINPSLQRGRALQKALINRLWREHRA